jgi:hypothetical protein
MNMHTTVEECWPTRKLHKTSQQDLKPELPKNETLGIISNTGSHTQVM